jgi:hypothetical protein
MVRLKLGEKNMKQLLFSDNWFGRSLFANAITVLVIGFSTNIAVADWHSREYGDAFDDNKRFLAVTRNLTEESLVLKCDTYMDDVYLAFYLDEYIDNGETKSARIRFDKNAIIEMKGYADGKTFVVFDEVYVNKLLSGFRTSLSIAIEVYSYDYDRIVSTFDLRGYAVAEEEVRSTCRFPS